MPTYGSTLLLEEEDALIVFLASRRGPPSTPVTTGSGAER